MMKNMMIAGLLALSTAALAGELDPQINLPGALIVRENAQGQKEVFKAGDIAVKSDADALAAAVTFATDANKVSGVAQSQSAGELDRVSSDESCFYWYSSYRSYPSYGSYPSYSYYPTYSYHSYNSYAGCHYVNYYYPSYSYSYRGYSYSYYTPRSRYCYSY